MAINLADKLTAKTTEGIIADSKEVFYDDAMGSASSGNTVAAKISELDWNDVKMEELEIPESGETTTVIDADFSTVAMKDGNGNILSEMSTLAIGSVQHQDASETVRDIDASYQEIFNANEASRQATFNSKEATRDAANQAALDAADTLSGLTEDVADLSQKVGKISGDVETLSGTVESHEEKLTELDAQINGGNILEYKKTINANSGQAILSSSNKFNVDFKNGDDIIVHITDSNNAIQPADSGCNIQFFAADGSLIEAKTASTNKDISIKLTYDVALIGMYAAASKVVSDGTIILKVVKPSTIPNPIVKQISDIQKSVTDANNEIAALSLSVSQAESEVNEVNSQINGGDLVVKNPVMTAGGLFYGASAGRVYSDASNFLADNNSHYTKIDLGNAKKVVVEYENINTGSSSQTIVLDKNMNVLYAIQEKNITLSSGKYKIEVTNDLAAYLYISCKKETKVVSYTYQVDGKFAELEKNISVLQQGSTTINIDFANKINGYVVASTGKMADGQGSFFHTQPMSVVKGQTVKFNAKGYNNVVAMVAKVLPTDYATLVTSVDSNQRDYVYEVVEDCDIIICFDNRAMASGNVFMDVPKAISALTSARKSVLVGESRTITTIKEAVEQANALALSGYEVDIVIDKGTYNAFEGFSLASESSSFIGLLLENNVNIIGNGDASEIIINGALPKTMSDYAYQRNNVAVFNSWRNNSYKNITINATNMRYCIHNDWSPNSQHVDDAYELYDSIILNSYQDADVDTKAAAWPIGSAACNGRVTEFRFCIFNNASNTDHCVNIHNRRNSTKPCKWIFESCQMIGGKYGAFYIGSEGTHQRDIVSINGCKIPNAITFYASSGYTGDNEMNLCGYGNLLNGFDYRTGITEGSGKEMLIP